MPLRPEMRMAGQAVTLRFIPAREDLARDEQMASGDFPSDWIVPRVQDRPRLN